MIGSKFESNFAEVVFFLIWKGLHSMYVFNRPSVAGDVLQTSLLLIN